MADDLLLYSDLVVLGGLALIGVILLGVQLVAVARDSDTWLIARGVTRGRIAQLRRRHLAPSVGIHRCQTTR